MLHICKFTANRRFNPLPLDDALSLASKCCVGGDADAGGDCLYKTSEPPSIATSSPTVVSKRQKKPKQNCVSCVQAIHAIDVKKQMRQTQTMNNMQQNKNMKSTWIQNEKSIITQLPIQPTFAQLPIQFKNLNLEPCKTFQSSKLS